MVRKLVLFAVFVSLLFVSVQDAAHAAVDHNHVSHAAEGHVHDADTHETQSSAKHDNPCLDCCHNHCQHTQWMPQNGSFSANLASHGQRISMNSQFFSGLIHSPDSPPPNIL